MKKRYPFLPKNWLSFSLYAVLTTCFSLNLQAQIAPAKQWDKTFGGSDEDMLYAMQQVADGGFILSGSSNSNANGDKSQPSKGSYDFWVIKLDSNGTKLWDKTFGGTSADNLIAFQQTSDGGYILGGTSNSNISGDKSQASKGGVDIWILKLDGNGNKLWDKTFGESGNDGLGALSQTADGGYILGGISDSGIGSDKSQPSRGGNDFWVIKLDANGNKTWDKTFGGSYTDNLIALQQTSDGGYLLGGFSNSISSGDKSQASNGGYDYWIIKLNASGTLLWDKTFGGSDSDYFSCLQQTSDGKYILGGLSASDLSGDKSQPNNGLNTTFDYWIIKIDANGIKLWDKTIGGTTNENLRSLKQTADGGFILGGESNSGVGINKSQPSQGSEDYWLVRLDAGGNYLWDKTLGGGGTDYFNTLQQLSGGGLILGGSSNSGLSGDKTQASKGAFDYWIVKLGSNALGTKETITPNVKLYPNPTNGIVNLELETAHDTEIVVLNTLGQQLLSKSVGKSTEKVNLQLIFDHRPKGIYLVQLKTEKQTIIKKVIVE